MVPERTVGRLIMRSERRWDVLTLGETLALLRPCEIGALRHVHELRLSVGGSESNVAVGVARLGGRAAWVGRVGDDELGARVLREIRGEGVDVHAVVDPEAPTALMIKEQRNSQQTKVSYYRRDSAGSRLQSGDLPPGAVADATVLHLSGITPGLSATARALVEEAGGAARDAGTLVSLDLNYREALWSAKEFGAAMRELLPGVDLVFGSPHEVEHVLGGRAGPPQEQLEALAAFGPAEAVLKLGADGAVVLVDGVLHERRAVEVRVVDTVGAGDAFVAGWLADLVNRPEDVAGRLSTAIACGAYACTVPGDWEGAPTRGDVESLLRPSDDEVQR